MLLYNKNVYKEYSRAVSTKSKTYQSNIRIWEKCRDVVAGEEVVKSKNTEYLPKTDGMKDDDYRIYIERAEFFNATGRTLEGLHGLMFRKEPIVTCDEKYKDYLENVDNKGGSASQFSSDAGYDGLMVGWGGILVDVPSSEVMSVKEAEEANIYPYLSLYKAEDIINVVPKQSGRKTILALVVLHEKFDTKGKDEFTFIAKDRYRVLDFDENGNYRQRLFVDNKVVAETVPTKGGLPLKEIPFWFTTSIKPEKPLLIDLVNVNLAWYRKSADYESGLHYVSVPTPYTTGFTPEDDIEIQTDKDGNQYEIHKAKEPIRLTPNRFLHFPSDCTGVGMLEFSGSGLSSISNAMLNDEERMAILGARIISAEKKGVEAAETAKIHRAGENSVLSAFANNLSAVMTKVLKFYLEWCTNQEDVEINFEINTDYDVSEMSGSELASLVAAWQSGAISKRVLFYNLQNGERIPNNVDYDSMQAEIEEEEPTNIE